MSSRSLVNVGLLLAAVILGLVVWRKPGKAPPKAPVTVTSLKPADITRIALKRTDSPDITLEKRDTHWVIVGHPDLPASQFSVAELLRLADQKVSRSYPLAQMHPAQLKLDKPRATVRFNKGPLIRFGTTDAIDGDRYLQVGDHVYLIPDDYQAFVEGHASTFISHRLLPANASVVGIRTPHFDLHRNKKGHWTLTPNNPKVSADDIQTFVAGWGAASAITVEKYTQVAKRQAGNDRTITVRLQGRKAPIKFLIIRRKPELILLREDLGYAYHMGSDGIRRLLQLPEVHIKNKKTSSKKATNGASAQ